MGGTGSYSSTKVGPGDPLEIKTTNFSILPNAGYFIVDKLVVGINTGITFSRDDNDFVTNVGSSVTSYKAGPFIRYYFSNPEKQLNFFAHGRYNYGINHFNNFGQKTSSPYNTYSFLVARLYS